MTWLENWKHLRYMSWQREREETTHRNQKHRKHLTKHDTKSQTMANTNIYNKTSLSLCFSETAAINKSDWCAERETARTVFRLLVCKQTVCTSEAVNRILNIRSMLMKLGRWVCLQLYHLQDQLLFIWETKAVSFLTYTVRCAPLEDFMSHFWCGETQVPYCHFITWFSYSISNLRFLITLCPSFYPVLC